MIGTDGERENQRTPCCHRDLKRMMIYKRFEQIVAENE